MTVIAGFPDDSSVAPNDFLAINQGVAVYPTTLTIDVARWNYSIVAVRAGAGAVNTVTVTGQWTDVLGGVVLLASQTLAVLPGNAALIYFVVAHMGSSFQLGLSGGNATTTVVVLNTNRNFTTRPLFTPGMAGTTILSTSDALLAGAHADHTVRGTGGAENAAAAGYCGPALFSVITAGGGPCSATVRDVNGHEIGGAYIPAAPPTGALAVSSSLWIPPTQYSIHVEEGSSADTIGTTLVAT